MSSTNKEGRTPIFDSELKIAIAREYLTSNLGYGKLAVKYELPGPDTVRFFVRWYKKNYPSANSPDSGSVQENNLDSTKDTKELQKELKEANLKIAGLEILIETAQKELGVDIIKKRGTKQSFK